MTPVDGKTKHLGYTFTHTFSAMLHLQEFCLC